MAEILINIYLIGLIVSFLIFLKETFFSRFSPVINKAPLVKYTVGTVLIIYNALMWPIRLIEYMSEQIYRPGI